MTTPAAASAAAEAAKMHSAVRRRLWSMAFSLDRCDGRPALWHADIAAQAMSWGRGVHRVVRQALSYGSTDPVRCKTAGSPVAWPGLAGEPGSARYC
jgi:hypothetical protein